MLKLKELKKECGILLEHGVVLDEIELLEDYKVHDCRHHVDEEYYVVDGESQDNLFSIEITKESVYLLLFYPDKVQITMWDKQGNKTIL